MSKLAAAWRNGVPMAWLKRESEVMKKCEAGVMAAWRRLS